MMLPPRPCAAICRRQARVVRKAPSRWMASIRLQSSNRRSTSGEMICTPALETRTSTPPNWATTFATPPSTCFSSVTSMVPPGAAGPSARAVSSAPRMSAMATRAPSCKYRSAMARPIPLAAPVTMATLPCSFMTASFWRSQRPPENPAELAEDPAPEGDHADHEDGALGDSDPGAELGQIVFQGGQEDRAGDGTEDRAEPADQRHEDHFAARVPVHVG